MSTPAKTKTPRRGSENLQPNIPTSSSSPMAKTPTPPTKKSPVFSPPPPPLRRERKFVVAEEPFPEQGSGRVKHIAKAFEILIESGKKEKNHHPHPRRERELVMAGDGEPEPEPEPPGSPASDPEPQPGSATVTAGDPEPEPGNPGDPEPEPGDPEPEPGSASVTAGDPEPEATVTAGDPEPESESSATVKHFVKTSESLIKSGKKKKDHRNGSVSFLLQRNSSGLISTSEGAMGAELPVFTQEEMTVDEALGFPKAYALLCMTSLTKHPYIKGPPLSFIPYALNSQEALRVKELDQMFPVINLEVCSSANPRSYADFLWEQLDHLGNAGFEPAFFRVDHFGNVIYRHADSTSPLAWDIDHWFPCSRGGKTVACNLRILQWQVCKEKKNKLDFLIPWWDFQLGISVNQFLSIFVSKNSDFRNRALSFLFQDGGGKELNCLQNSHFHSFPQNFMDAKRKQGLAPAAIVLSQNISETMILKAIDLNSSLTHNSRSSSIRRVRRPLLKELRVFLEEEKVFEAGISLSFDHQEESEEIECIVNEEEIHCQPTEVSKINDDNPLNSKLKGFATEEDSYKRINDHKRHFSYPCSSLYSLEEGNDIFSVSKDQDLTINNKLKQIQHMELNVINSSELCRISDQQRQTSHPCVSFNNVEEYDAVLVNDKLKQDQNKGLDAIKACESQKQWNLYISSHEQQEENEEYSIQVGKRNVEKWLQIFLENSKEGSPYSDSD